jgi:hypothetical protein
MNISPANVLLELASFRSQALSSLMSLSSDQSGSSATSDFAKILGMKTEEAETQLGRNMSLRDPEAAYSMMTQINEFAVTFKAQFTELSALGSSVEQMEAVGGELSDIDPATGNAAIQSQLQDFVAQYNSYVDRFMPQIQPGGMLDNVQAAEVSL